MRVVVTGGAGFIGSNLVDRLLRDGHDVTVIDNCSTGRMEFLDDASQSPAFSLVEMDLLQAADRLNDTVAGADAVVHLAANADVRFGWDHPSRDLQQNVIATHSVLEALRTSGVDRLVYASTGSVYGEATVIPTPEDAPFPVQTSLYAASKLAAEGMIQAYQEGVGLKGTIFRFVSVLGPRYTHGHVIDFMRHLRRDPTVLPILGDGQQRKSYFDVDDCVEAIALALNDDTVVGVFNLGVDEVCRVVDSAGWIADRLGVEPRFEFSGGDRGWVGDNPHIHLDTRRIQARGWKPTRTIQESIVRTVDWLLAEPWVLDLSEQAATQ